MTQDSAFSRLKNETSLKETEESGGRAEPWGKIDGEGFRCNPFEVV